MKNFITLDFVPCHIDNEFKCGEHLLMPNLDYETTNPRFDTNGNFLFELYDYDGFIGRYLIEKKYLYLIQEISFAEPAN